MAERSNAHDSKSCDAGMYPWVQIPLSAPAKGRGRIPRPFAVVTGYRVGLGGGDCGSNRFAGELVGHRHVSRKLDSFLFNHSSFLTPRIWIPRA